MLKLGTDYPPEIEHTSSVNKFKLLLAGPVTKRFFLNNFFKGSLVTAHRIISAAVNCGMY